MKIISGRFFRKRKNVSREERAEKFLRHFSLPSDGYADVLPRLGLVLLFVVSVLLLFPPSRRTHDVIFKAGEIADRNVIAPFDFEVPLSVEDLNMQRASATLRVLPVYNREVAVEQDLTRSLTALFDSLRTISGMDSLTDEQKVGVAGSVLPYLSRGMVQDLLGKTAYEAMRKATAAHQKNLFERGFIDNAGPLRRGGYTEIALMDGNNESRIAATRLVDQVRVDDVIKEEGFKRFKNNRTRAQAFFEITRSNVLPNMIFDSGETENRRQQATAMVPKTVRVSKNERIIGKHDKVTKEQEKTLVALERARASVESMRSPVILVGLYTGEILRLLMFGILLGGYILVFHRKVYDDLVKLTAILSILLIYMVFAAVIVRFNQSQYLIPVAFVSLMVSALFGYRLGLVTTVFACFLVPLVTNLGPHMGFVSLMAGSMAVVGLLKIRSRSHFYSVFLFVSLAYVVGVLSTELGQVEEMKGIYANVGWGVVNSLFSILTVMFLLPIFEGVFNLTTRFTLLELTDLNKPILKRLNMEAPGTYHHSMLLGSLVDAVAADVGADPLKARVCAYYHDIGKTLKPEYYAENQEAGFNKHEKITPQMSSLILLSHVKDGVELAREEKLPDMIIDAIQQHHGTTVMAFFYQKALDTDSHSSVNKDDFRYPGPKPQTKETAILMLADTVEPACRSIADSTAAAIRNMVAKLVNMRAQEGELDECGLTMNNLARIREKFVSILTGIYHKRVAYPGQDEKEEEQQGEAVAKPVR